MRPELQNRRFFDPQAARRPCPDGEGLTLRQLSGEYRAAAELLRQRLRQLRIQLKTATDPEEIWHLRRRMAELTPMLTQVNELAELTEHYYERGYYRNEKYTL